MHFFFSFMFTGGSIYNGNVMKIHSVGKEDRGTYYCFADNEVGKGDRRNINLEVVNMCSFDDDYLNSFIVFRLNSRL